MICTVCERGCRVPEGSFGACGMYCNTHGTMRERFPDHYLMVCPISAETMPVLHFHPANKFLQITTLGCNLDCPGCVSNLIVRGIHPGCTAVKHLPPEAIVAEAIKQNCLGVAFLMNDPLASLPTFIRVATKAKESGLLVGCSTNGYFTEHSLRQLMPVLDFINVGFKGISDRSYAECGGKDAGPVLRNVRMLVENGVHVEASCVHKAGNEQELLQLAGRLAGIHPDIPLHLMRFIPLENTEISLEPSIKLSELFCGQLRKLLRYVYLFNSPGTRYLDTLCPGCGEVLYSREFYGPMGAKLRSTRTVSAQEHDCPGCGTRAAVKGTVSGTAYGEEMFEGGYPFTRALEMMEAILISIGVNTEKDFVKVLNHVLTNFSLQQLHKGIQSPEAYMTIIQLFGELTGHSEKARELNRYIKEKLSFIQEGLREKKYRPRVYYVMGKPLFCLNAERMENSLVEFAGGSSVNKQVEGKGRPGFGITPETLNQLNPEHIFISSFFSNRPDDFYADCIEAGIDVEAVRNYNIHIHPVPVSDFGSPRWVLGLLHIANVLHPEIFQFNVPAETAEFYHRFYNTEYMPDKINKSFGKPLSTWKLSIG